MINKIKQLLKEFRCNHKDIRYKSDNCKYKYIDVCCKCGAKRYIKGK